VGNDDTRIRLRSASGLLYTFAVDRDIGLERAPSERFLREFLDHHPREMPDAFKAALDNEFGDCFECGVQSGHTLVSGSEVFVTISAIGTENTTPARRPQGCWDPEER